MNKNLGTAFMQCTARPVVVTNSPAFTIGYNFQAIPLNHIPLNYKSLVTLVPSTSSFTLEPGTYKAYWNITAQIFDTTFTFNYTAFSAKLRNTSTNATVCRWVNSFIGQANAGNFCANQGDYTQESAFRITSPTTLQLQARIGANQNWWLGWNTATAFSNVSPYQVIAQLRLERISL